MPRFYMKLKKQVTQEVEIQVEADSQRDAEERVRAIEQMGGSLLSARMGMRPISNNYSTEGNWEFVEIEELPEPD